MSQKQEGCKCPVSQNHPPPEMGLSNPSWKSLTSLSTTHLHTPTVWQLLFPDSCEQFNKLVKVTKASACAVSNVLGCLGSKSTCFFFRHNIHLPPGCHVLRTATGNCQYAVCSFGRPVMWLTRVGRGTHEIGNPPKFNHGHCCSLVAEAFRGDLSVGEHFRRKQFASWQRRNAKSTSFSTLNKTLRNKAADFFHLKNQVEKFLEENEVCAFFFAIFRGFFGWLSRRHLGGKQPPRSGCTEPPPWATSRPARRR